MFFHIYIKVTFSNSDNLNELMDIKRGDYFMESTVLELVDVLMAQEELLDAMLEEQKILHDNIKSRNWTNLESNIFRISAYSNGFVELDQRRDEMMKANPMAVRENETRKVFFRVRTKLTKSKIENDALNAYVNATQAFIGKVMEECIPNRKPAVYGKTGRMVPGEGKSLLVNTVL